jgi:Dual specificity phosphatase, catalytic domain
MQHADFTSQRIEGFTREGNHQFSVPLFSHIEGNLWVGGCPVEKSPGEFDFIVCMYPWGVYEVQKHQCFTSVQMLDSPNVANEGLLLALARHVNECVKHGKTLVHCQAGLNRSNLIAGLALIERGVKPADAIALLRAKRSPAVLCNKAFESWLLSREQNNPSLVQ